MAIERQRSFGWLIVVAVFLGGAGGGLFFISFILGILNLYEPLARIGIIFGPILVLICAFVLLLDLGTKSKLYKLYSNLSSWVGKGTYFITVFVLSGFAYSLPFFGPFAWIPWRKGLVLGEVIGVVAAIFSVLVMLYTGFLFSAVKSIPLWNTPILPILFFFSSLDVGMAILLEIEHLSVGNPEGVIHTLVVIEIILILIQLLVLLTFLTKDSYGSVTAVESIRLIKKPLFNFGVIIGGLIIPFGILLYYSIVSSIRFANTILAIVGLLIITGGFLLRYCIIRGGVRLPLYPA